MGSKRKTFVAAGPRVFLLAIAACAAGETSNSTTSSGGSGGSQASTQTGSTGGSATTAVATATGGAGGATATSTAGTAGSSTTTNPTTGAGGSAATGGAGGAGAGGAGTGGGGAGTGGGSADAGLPSCPAPTAATGIISDFTAANVANQLTGATDVWFSPGTAVVMNGVMHFTAPAGQAVSAPIASIPGSISCVDLTGRYTSISFKISSSTNTMLKFELLSKEIVTAQDGSGFSSVFSVTPTLSTVTIMLSSLTAAPGGMGYTQSTIPGFSIVKDAAAIAIGATSQSEALDITLDDVTFQ